MLARDHCVLDASLTGLFDYSVAVFRDVTTGPAGHIIAVVCNSNRVPNVGLVIQSVSSSFIWFPRKPFNENLS